MSLRRSIASQIIPVAFLTFAALGLASGLLGLAWPSMRAQFGLALDAVNAIYIASTAACTVVSFLVGRLMGRFGTGATLLGGAALLAVSMFGFAAAHTWGQIVCLSAVSGLGSGLIDAGLNLYLATYHAAKQLNGLHACFGIGSTLGPLVMTAVLDRKLGWQAGYAVAGAGMTVAVVLLALTFRRWQGDGPRSSAREASVRASFASTGRVPAVWLGVGGFVCCVGLEVAAGQWAYTLLVQSRGMRADLAGVVVSAYWGTFTCGRILFGFLPARLDSVRLLPGLAAGMVVGAVLFWWQPAAGVPGLILLGFAEAPLFPLLMAGTMRRVGARHTQNAVAFQMFASGLAAALIPGLIGTAGNHLGLEAMSACLVVLAVFVFGFSLLCTPAAEPKQRRRRGGAGGGEPVSGETRRRLNHHGQSSGGPASGKVPER